MPLADEKVFQLSGSSRHGEDLELGKLFLEEHSNLPEVPPWKISVSTKLMHDFEYTNACTVYHVILNKIF